VTQQLTTNKTMNSNPNFTGKCENLWKEMENAVRDAIGLVGRETVLKALDGSRFIVLNGDEIELQGTMDDVAIEVDNLYTDLESIMSL